MGWPWCDGDFVHGGGGGGGDVSWVEVAIKGAYIPGTVATYSTYTHIYIHTHISRNKQ